VSNLPIKVQYCNNNLGEVKPYQLEKLISLGRVKKFYRSRGWVIVGKDRMRGTGGSYSGAERRKPLTIRFL
jgi:hypothetical protein